jgi:hypothetical protein
MINRLCTRFSITLLATLVSLLAGIAASPALASASAPSAVTASGCSSPQLSQQFLSLGDPNWYALPLGQTPDNFDGAGWTLVAGANIATAQLADGHTGSVLSLPSGAAAVSPPICVNADYSTARAMIQSTAGARVEVGVMHLLGGSSGVPQRAGEIQGSGAGFSASAPFNIAPGPGSGWRLVRFAFQATDLGGHAQLYDFYLDPRMK